jgi:hypothetical protein
MQYVQTEHAILALERLRGAVQAMAHFRGCAIFAVIRPCLPCLLTVLQLYSHHALITGLLFKLATALVDDVLPGLEYVDEALRKVWPPKQQQTETNT